MGGGTLHPSSNTIFWVGACLPPPQHHLIFHRQKIHSKFDKNVICFNVELDMSLMYTEKQFN